MTVDQEVKQVTVLVGLFLLGFVFGAASWLVSDAWHDGLQLAMWVSWAISGMVGLAALLDEPEPTYRRCDQCARSLPADDVERYRVGRWQERFYCDDCLAEDSRGYLDGDAA